MESGFWRRAWLGALAAALLSMASAAPGAEQVLARAPVYGVCELSFQGPRQSASDAPARDVQLSAVFEHESGAPRYEAPGFFDGDGRGGAAGDVFKIRFCPTAPGKWTVRRVESSAPKLKGQHEGDVVIATESKLPGFWLADESSPGHRWYRRSNGTHQYIFGNTHYSFLSGYGPGDKLSGNDIAGDVAENAKYFKKLRFSLFSDRCVNPDAKPFLDDQGRPTDDGDYSYRPNPSWFHERADLAVRTAFEHDLIADLILAGPDTEDARATLRAAGNKGDPAPWLRYVAARYGSYPNVWICLSNEYDIRKPTYTEKQIARFGKIIDEYLPYPTPVSVHNSSHMVWAEAFDKLPPWNDHQIVQKKLKRLAPSADVIGVAWGAKLDKPRNKPTINDELSYQGAGDEHTRDDTIESHLGAFLGGGYASTGHKSGNKLGQYFIGKFDPAEHTAADHLRFLRELIDKDITFWRMTPDVSIFQNLDPAFRGMAWPEHEYVLGTDQPHADLVANLPPGAWTVTRHDIIRKESKIIDANAKGPYRFDAPAGRAVLFHFRKNEK